MSDSINKWIDIHNKALIKVVTKVKGKKLKRLKNDSNSKHS